MTLKIKIREEREREFVLDEGNGARDV